MKKLLLIFSLFAARVIIAQAPQFLNYQGVARDAVGTVINSGNIGIRFEIWRTSPSGTKVYQEEMSATPSAAGIFTTAIGSGSNTIVGAFTSINWANGPYFIVVGIDPTGGTSFSTVGTSQLLSVPYALYAETAGNAPTFVAGNGITINSGTITNAAPNKTVGINPSGITNVLGTYPNYTVDVAAPNLNYNSGTQVLTLTQGSAVTMATITAAASGTVSMFASGIASVTPVGAGTNFTVSVQTPSFTGAGSTTVTGTYPNYLIQTPPASTVAAATPVNIAINPPHATTTLSPGNYSINVQPTNVSGAGVASVSGSYPNYTVNVPPPALASSGNTLTITQGTAVSTATLGGGPWAVSSGVLFPAFNPTDDKVAIGQNSASSNLDILNAAGSTNTLNPVVSIVNSNSSFTGNALLSIKNNGTIGALMQGDNFGGGDGLDINMNSATGSGNGIQTRHYGTGNAGYFEIANSTSNGRVMVLSTIGKGNLLNGSLSNSISTADAIYVTNNGMGVTANLYKSNTGAGLIMSHTGSSGNAGFFNISSASNPSQGLLTQSAGSGDALATYNTGTGRALYASGASGIETALFNNSSNNGRALTASTSNTTETADFINFGNGAAIYASSSGSVEAVSLSNTGTARTMIASNSSALETILMNNTGNGRAFVAQNPAATVARAGLIIGGLDIMGKTSGSSTFPLIVTNAGSTNLFNVRDDGNVGIGVSNPGYRLSVFEPSSAAAAIYASQNSAASSPGAHGIYGLTSNSNIFAAGVMGDNNGAGPGIYGIKNGGSGPAGRFEQNLVGNSADALFVVTKGTGASVHAVNNSNTTGASVTGDRAALWIEEGHIRTTQFTKPNIALGAALTGAASCSINGPGSDVAGEILFNSGTVSGTSPFVLVNITFNKQYASAPIVIITARNTTACSLPIFVSPGVNGFTLQSVNAPAGSSNYQYNYLVIEK